MEHLYGIPLTIAYIILLVYCIKKWGFFNDESISKKLFILFFIYKLCLGFILTAIYTYYYTDTQYADIYKYFNDSYYMTRALWESPIDFFKMLFGIGNDTPYFSEHYYSKMNNWFRLYESEVYNDNHTIIRFNAALRIISLGYYHVHGVIMDFLSFFGIFCFYKAFNYFMPKDKHFYFGLLIFLFPSLNFWSAGVLKEGLLIFGLGVIFLCIIKILNNEKHMKFYLLSVFALFLLLYLKSYALAAVLTGSCIIVMGVLLKRLPLWVSLTSLLLVFVVIFAVAKFNYETEALSLINQKHLDSINLSREMHAGSYFNIGNYGATWNDILSQMPNALWTGIFRPTIFEIKNPLMLLSAIESVIIFALVLLSIVFFMKPNRERFFAIIGSLTVVIILAILIGLTSANFGSLVRYKTPFLPFLLFASYALINVRKIKKMLGH